MLLLQTLLLLLHSMLTHHPPPNPHHHHHSRPFVLLFVPQPPAPHATMSGHSAFESSTQYYNDVALALAFSCTTLIAGKRMHWSYSQGGPTETTVVTAFYSLILTTALARAVWFAIPSEFLEPEYTPGTNQQPVTAFEGPWMGTFVSELVSKRLRTNMRERTSYERPKTHRELRETARSGATRETNSVI